MLFAPIMQAELAEKSLGRNRGFQVFTGERVNIRRIDGQVVKNVLVAQGSDTKILTGGLWLIAGEDFARVWMSQD